MRIRKRVYHDEILDIFQYIFLRRKVCSLCSLGTRLASNFKTISSFLKGFLFSNKKLMGNPSAFSVFFMKLTYPTEECDRYNATVETYRK